MAWYETCWKTADGKHKVTIGEVLDILKNDPVVTLSLSDLEHIKVLSRSHEKIVCANLVYPIIVVESDCGYCSILDGHHRLAKAKLLGNQDIKAKILKTWCIPVQMLRVIN